MNITAQIIGFIASCISIFAAQSKHKKKLLGLVTLASTLFAINYILLSAYTGALACLLEVLESATVNIFDSKKKDVPKLIIIIFLLIAILGGIITYNNIYSVIAIISNVLFVVAIIPKKMNIVRRITLILYILWIIYDVVVGAYSSLLSDIFIATSNLIAIFRYDIFKRTKKH
jgi:hypothetical protein